MIITAKKGKGNKMHVYIDDEYRFTVTTDFWFSGAYRCGDEISDEDLMGLKKRAQTSQAYNKALNLISRRDHCKKELEEKLSRSVDKESAIIAVQKAMDMGFVNDEIYANKYAEELFRRKGFSVSRIRMELIHKGVARDVADKVSLLFDYDPKERITELIKNGFHGLTCDEKMKTRTIATLVRLGYDYADIRSAMRDLSLDTPEE
jgi:regulatory protein